MNKLLILLFIFGIGTCSVYGQSWPRFFWEQIEAADTLGAVGVADADGNGYWSDSLRWENGFLYLLTDTAATMAYARDVVPEVALDIIEGLALDKPDLDIVNTGGTLYLEVEKIGGGDVRFWLNGEVATLDCTTGAGTGGKARVALTAGTDARNPALNYFYATGSGATATLNAAANIPTGLFCWIGKALVPDVTTWTSEGEYVFQRFTESINDSRGQISHEREKIRLGMAGYSSGVAPSFSVSSAESPDSLIFTTTGGKVYQMHQQSWPVFNNEKFYYGNGLNGYERLDNLNEAIYTSDSTSIGNNRYFSIVLWGAVNIDSARCKVFVNTSNDVYLSADAAKADADNTSDYTVPNETRSVAFMIARVVLRHQTAGSGTFTEVETYDLRGQPPGIRIGGTSTAPPSVSNDFQDNLFNIFDEGDPTKRLFFQLSGVTTANDRTLTVPDKSGTIALLDDITGGFTNFIIDDDGGFFPQTIDDGETVLFTSVGNDGVDLTVTSPNTITAKLDFGELDTVTSFDINDHIAMRDGTSGDEMRLSESVLETWVNSVVDVGGFTEGSIIFADASGDLTEDNAGLYYDDTDNYLVLSNNNNINIVSSAAQPNLAGITTGGYNFAAGRNNLGSLSSGSYNYAYGRNNMQSNSLYGPNFSAGLENARDATLSINTFLAGTYNARLATSVSQVLAVGSQNGANAALIQGSAMVGANVFKFATGNIEWSFGLADNILPNTTGNIDNVFLQGETAGNLATDTNADDVIGIGRNVLRSASELSNVIAFGENAADNNAYTPVVAIGDNSEATKNGEITLGSSSYTYGRWNITGQVRLATGTTAQRGASLSTGDFRYNTTLSSPEWYNGSTWVQPGTGSGSMDGFYFGNDASTTLINEGETIRVQGGSNGVDITRAGNDLTAYLDFADLTTWSSVTTGSTTYLAGMNSSNTEVKYSTSSVEEWIEDNMGNSVIVGGTNITATYDDGAGTITLDGTGGGGSMDDFTWGGDASTTTISDGETIKVQGATGLSATLSTNDVEIDYDFTAMGNLAAGSISTGDYLMAYDASDAVNRYKRVAPLNFVIPGIETGDQIVLNSVSVEPTGSKGGLFYDDDDDKVKMYSGATSQWHIMALEDDVPAKWSGFTEYTATTSLSPVDGEVIFLDALEGTANLTLTINPINLATGDRIRVVVNGDATYDHTIATSGGEVFYSSDIDGTSATLPFSGDSVDHSILLIYDGADFFTSITTDI